MQGEFEHDEVHSEGEGAQVCLFQAHSLIRFTEYLAAVPCQCTPDELIERANGSFITCRTPLDLPAARKHWIDTEISIAGSLPEVG